MSTLKKGDLVMTDMGLAWYDRIDGEHLVNPVSWEKDHLSPHFTATKATRAEVETYLNGKAWWMITPVSCSNDKSNWIVFSVSGEWNLMLDTTINPVDFDTAPAMQTEAILMAKLLNATKD